MQTVCVDREAHNISVASKKYLPLTGFVTERKGDLF
jgi:hypothetical protein